MWYVIMNMNSLLGFQKKHFTVLSALYYVGHKKETDGTEVDWTHILSKAKRFESEKEARMEALCIWGEWFVNSSMVIVAVHHDLLEATKAHESDIHMIVNWREAGVK